MPSCKMFVCEDCRCRKELSKQLKEKTEECEELKSLIKAKDTIYRLDKLFENRLRMENEFLKEELAKSECKQKHPVVNDFGKIVPCYEEHSCNSCAFKG